MARNGKQGGGGTHFKCSTRTSIKLLFFSLFMMFSMLVLSSVVVWSAGEQSISSQITMEYHSPKIKLTFANYSGSVVTPTNCDIVYSADKTKFKIVGPTPILTSTSTSTNTTNNERTAISTTNTRLAVATTGPTGKVSAITDLANSSGAEFYYFCTNSSVTSTTSYTDPGTIYWTSTADDTLETWYDIPSQKITLYSCFMTPNFTGAEVDSSNTYNGSATQIVISNNVENILYRAFYNKSTITNVVIPQSVKNIGYGTSNTSYGAFHYCEGLANIIIPNSVTSIGDFAFYCCYGLTSITIGSGVTSIGWQAFSQCKGLTGTLTIPDSVTSIGSSAFYYCSGLTGALTIPIGVTSVGSDAFGFCNGLTSITVASGNTTYYSSGNCLIETSTKTLIQGCKNSTIPSGVISIGDYAFCGCSGLTSITIPGSVTSVGNSAFSSCTGLTSITIPNSVTSIGQHAFSSCSGLTGTLTIPNSVTSIGNYAFYGCKGLTGTLTIPSGVTSVGAYAFSNCGGLTSITIPSSVTSIGSYAFSYGSGLTSITIPNSVTSIGIYAFYKCTNLTNVTFADTSKTWKIYSYSFRKGETVAVASYSPTNTSTNATYLKSTYYSYSWTRNS